MSRKSTLDPEEIQAGKCLCGGLIVEERVSFAELHFGCLVRRVKCWACGRDGHMKAGAER